MKLSIVCTLAAVALAAACNTPREGAYGNVRFTPRECGQVGGCDFDDSIGVGGTISVTISGIAGFSTAGVDLRSDDPDLLAVTRRADLGGQPAWDLTSLASGVAGLRAVRDGETVDLLEIPMQEVQYLTMVPFVGDIVGPTEEEGYDEAFTVNADQAVSWFVRPAIAGGATTMGRFAFETVLDAGSPRVTDHEESNSDRPNGYLYVTLPSGDYPVRFELSRDQDVYVEAIIHAR